MIEPTKVDRGHFERIAKAVRPFESVLRELRRVENWIDRQRKLLSGAQLIKQDAALREFVKDISVR